MYRTSYEVTRGEAWTITLRIVTVGFLILLANIFVAYVFNPIPTSTFPIRAYKLWHAPKSPDVVFIGSSATRENIDADLVSERLSVNAFNLGITGGGPYVERAIVEDVVLKRIDRGNFGMPRLWVFEFHPLELAPNFSGASGVAEVDEVRAWVGRYDDIDEAHEFLWDTFKNGIGPYQRTIFNQITHDISEHTPLLRLDHDWPTKDRVRRMVRQGLASAGIGEPPALIPSLPALYLKETVESYRITDTMVTPIADMIRLVQSRGGKIVIISFPFSDASGMPAEVMNRFQSVVRSVADAHGVPYYPLTTKDCGVVDEDYFDYIHVTRPARPKTTACVVEALRRHLEGNP